MITIINKSNQKIALKHILKIVNDILLHSVTATNVILRTTSVIYKSENIVSYKANNFAKHGMKHILNSIFQQLLRLLNMIINSAYEPVFYNNHKQVQTNPLSQKRNGETCHYYNFYWFICKHHKCQYRFCKEFCNEILKYFSFHLMILQILIKLFIDNIIILFVVWFEISVKISANNTKFSTYLVLLKIQNRKRILNKVNNNVALYQFLFSIILPHKEKMKQQDQKAKSNNKKLSFYFYKNILNKMQIFKKILNINIIKIFKYLNCLRQWFLTLTFIVRYFYLYRAQLNVLLHSFFSVFFKNTLNLNLNLSIMQTILQKVNNNNIFINSLKKIKDIYLKCIIATIMALINIAFTYNYDNLVFHKGVFQKQYKISLNLTKYL